MKFIWKIYLKTLPLKNNKAENLIHVLIKIIFICGAECGWTEKVLVRSDLRFERERREMKKFSANSNKSLLFGKAKARGGKLKPSRDENFFSRFR